MKKVVVALSVVLSVSACVFGDRSEDYQKSGSIKKIEIPAEVESEPLDPLYPIPTVVKREDAFIDVEEDGFEIPRPEPMSADAEQTKVKIQKVGDSRWIVLEASTSQVWPLAQSFLVRNGIRVSRSEPKSGLIETEWVGFKDDKDNNSRFQIRIEKGVRPEVTEVHVLHKQAPLKATNDLSWPASSDDKERESWMLEAMGASLADDIRNKAASLLGQSVGGETKAELAVQKDEPVLILRLSRDRAWATVAHALKKEGFVIWDERDQENLFYVQYISAKENPGWFKRLFLPKSKEPVKKAPTDLASLLSSLADRPSVRQLFDGVSGTHFVTSSVEGVGYLVRLSSDGANMLVRVRDHQGQLLPLQKNKQLLAVIRRNLI